MKKFLIAIAALLMPVSVAASETYSNVGHWTIISDEHDCTMAVQYTDNSTLMLTYDVGKQSSWISISDPAIKSLEMGSKKSLDIVFVSDATVDRGWGSTNFDVLVLDDGLRVFRGRFSADMLTDFAKYKTLALFYNEKVIESMPLENSADAVRALRACAQIRYHANPSDPFA